MKQRNRKHGLTQLVSQVREYLVTPPQFSVDEIMRGTNDEARRLNAAIDAEPTARIGWLEPFDSSGQHAHKTLERYQGQLEAKRKRKRGTP